MQTAIGQGDTLATPMQMLMIADAVANGGRMMKPRFVKEVVSSDGNVVRTEESSTLREAMTPSEAASLH
jgi:peptidoglycan glycosyltransferase